MLSLYAKLLNFNEIIGISEISRIERIKISGINTYVCKKSPCRNELSWKINGSEAIKKALAGVGKPINELDCRSSIVNLASLNAENMAIRKAVQGRIYSIQFVESKLNPEFAG